MNAKRLTQEDDMAKGQDDRPWEEPGEIRRDAEPHHGFFLCGAATCSWLCLIGALLLSIVFVGHYPALTLAFVLTSGSGIVLAIWTWLGARKDLRRIQRNEIVFHGYFVTGAARDLAKAGFVIHLLLLFFWLGVFLIPWLIPR